MLRWRPQYKLRDILIMSPQEFEFISAGIINQLKELSK